MGILDQLKQEAAAKQQQNQIQVDTQKLSDQRYSDIILPTLQKTFHFMRELAEYLNFLEREIIIGNYSDTYPQLGRLIQKDYKVYTDDYGGFSDFNKLKQVNMRFYCLGDGAFSYTLEGKSRIEREISFLVGCNLTFDWKMIGRRTDMQTASFSVTRKIPVRFRFEIDYDQSKIRLLIRNHENFIKYNKLFNPEDVDGELLDEIARYMLRKDDDFYRLEISNDRRDAIRQMAEHAKREKSLLLVHDDPGTGRQALEKPNLVAHIKKLVGKN